MRGGMVFAMSGRGREIERGNAMRRSRKHWIREERLWIIWLGWTERQMKE